MTISAIDKINATAAASAAAGAEKKQSTAETDRFLKLLVTQMQNQDPLSPMENAEVTSQMAQINTVTGISNLNATVTSLSSSLAQMQMLQGASLVGRAVLLEGNALGVDPEAGTAGGGYELANKATRVQIDIMDSGGKIVDTIYQSNRSAGRQGFEWTPPEGMNTQGMTFQITATSGNTAVDSTPLSSALVQAINTANGTLTLELSNGTQMPYSQVKAVS